MAPLEETKTSPAILQKPLVPELHQGMSHPAITDFGGTEQSESDMLMKQLTETVKRAIVLFNSNGGDFLKTDEGNRELHAFLERMDGDLPKIFSILGNKKYCIKGVTQLGLLSSLYKTAGIENGQIDEAVLGNLETISEQIQHADSDVTKCLTTLTVLCAKNTLSDSQRLKIVELLASKYDVYLEDFSSSTSGTGTSCCLRTLMKYGDRKQQQDAAHALTAYSLYAYHTANGKKLDNIAKQLSYYFDRESSPEDRAIGEKIIGKTCEEYGLDTKEILDWWDNAGDDFIMEKPDGTRELVKRKHIVFERNIASMRALESQRKGILKL